MGEGWSNLWSPDPKERLKEHATSFIKQLNNSEQKMRQIVGEFQGIAAEVRKLMKVTDIVKKTRSVAKAFQLILFIAPPSLLGWVSLLATGAEDAAVVVTVAAAVATIYITQKIKEKGSAGKVENLGKEFLRIAEPLKKKLAEIKTTCERLEEESAAVQAENTLLDMEEFKRILRRAVDLGKRERTAEAERKFRESITKLAAQSQKIIDEFNEMETELRNSLALKH